MTAPTIQEINDFKVDLDAAESIVNGNGTVSTRLGGTKKSLGAITQEFNNAIDSINAQMNSAMADALGYTYIQGNKTISNENNFEHLFSTLAEPNSVYIFEGRASWGSFKSCKPLLKLAAGATPADDNRIKAGSLRIRVSVQDALNTTPTRLAPIEGAATIYQSGRDDSHIFVDNLASGTFFRNIYYSGRIEVSDNAGNETIGLSALCRDAESGGNQIRNVYTVLRRVV